MLSELLFQPLIPLIAATEMALLNQISGSYSWTRVAYLVARVEAGG